MRKTIWVSGYSKSGKELHEACLETFGVPVREPPQYIHCRTTDHARATRWAQVLGA